MHGTASGVTPPQPRVMAPSIALMKCDPKIYRIHASDEYTHSY
jgi:hypothetical protein